MGAKSSTVSAEHNQAAAKRAITVETFLEGSWGEIVHVKGFGKGVKAPWKELALGKVGDSCSTIAWDGDPPDDSGFTAIILEFLRARSTNRVVAFRDSEKLGSFEEKWNKYLDEFGDRIVLVAVDKNKDKDRFGLKDEDINVMALPSNAREFYFLGRIAIKATGSKKVVSVGGGGISGKEAEASFKDGVSWTVLAVSRGKPEKHETLLDWAKANPCPSLTFIQGIDAKESQGYASTKKGGLAWMTWCC